MLVFRCECDHVLGVENESSRGQAGECPACGRIIRVPDALVNAKGRLRLAGLPSRATPSGAFRQIKDTKMDGHGEGSGAKLEATNGTPPAPTPKVDTVFGDRGSSAEPETLAPLTENDMELVEEPAATEASAVTEELPSAPPPEEKKRDSRRISKTFRPAAKDPLANDPAAGNETRIDKNITATTGTAASSKRRKADAPAAVAAPKKSGAVLYIAIAVVLAIILALLFAFGVFGGSDKGSDKKNDSAANPPTKPDDKKAAEHTPSKPDETKNLSPNLIFRS